MERSADVVVLVKNSRPPDGGRMLRCAIASFMSKKVRDPETAAWDERCKREAEDEDFEAFANAYFRATGETLDVLDRPEPPDYLCEKADGTQIGVEITQIMRAPDEAMWERILHRRYDMDACDAAEHFDRLLAKKAGKLANFPIQDNILVFVSCETAFVDLVSELKSIPLEDLAEQGFKEVWLGDYQGIREGAHNSIRLLGLYPKHLRVFFDRPDYDQKPYG